MAVPGQRMSGCRRNAMPKSMKRAGKLKSGWTIHVAARCRHDVAEVPLLILRFFCLSPERPWHDACMRMRCDAACSSSFPHRPKAMMICYCSLRNAEEACTVWRRSRTQSRPTVPTRASRRQSSTRATDQGHAREVDVIPENGVCREIVCLEGHATSRAPTPKTDSRMRAATRATAERGELGELGTWRPC